LNRAPKATAGGSLRASRISCHVFSREKTPETRAQSQFHEIIRRFLPTRQGEDPLMICDERNKSANQSLPLAASPPMKSIDNV
jgi:hypothetical protein